MIDGAFLAPLTGAIAAIRRARMFHPEGVVYAARVEGFLEGDALVRLSSAWWRGGKEWMDVLGLAIRFQGKQDLLTATIRFPWTTPFAPLTTRVHTFLWNHYYGVSPFDVDGLGRVKLRLRSPRLDNDTGLSRSEHLAHTVREGRAAWTLEYKRRLGRWQHLSKVTLTEPLAIDQEALRFSPFNAGLGVRPVGFVHAIRRKTYAASQAARPLHQQEA